MDFSRVSQEEREKLYNEVWTDPVIIVAGRYNISDNGLRKHCKRLGVPLPPSGYWAKVRAGQRVYKQELPKVIGELKKYVYAYAIRYRTDIDQLTDEELRALGDLKLLTNETIEFIHNTCSQIQVKNQLKNPHNLIIKHKEESANRKKRDKPLNQSNLNRNYHSNTSSNYYVNKAILPIYVSDTNLNRAYRIIDTLITTLEDMEGYVIVSLDSGKDKAYFSLMHTTFYFEITEKNSKKRKNSSKDESLPLMVLSMRAENWFYRNLQQTMEYKDSDNEPLESQLGKIILQMFKTSNRIYAEEKIIEREQEREIAERDRQRRLEQMRRGELEEVKLLNHAASDWEKAQRIRHFINEMELRINDVSDAVKKEKLQKWLKWARDKADWLDPMTEKTDDLLGKSIHIFDKIYELDDL